MKLLPTILLFATGALIAKAYNKSKVTFLFTNLDFNTKSIVVELINPTAVTENVSALVADVYYNDTAFALLDFRKETNIPPGGAATIKVPLKFNILGGIELLYNLLTKAYKQKVSITIKGTLTASGIPLPIDKTLELYAGKK